MTRPTKTPEGFDFPYSHFGDTRRQTELLQNIGKILEFEPDLVINMGCGYDVTPSDAFPEAKVVHVDIVPGIVQFLKEAGFDACLPDDMPEDLEPDMVINILGPTTAKPEPHKGGMLLTTQVYELPENMNVGALVLNGPAEAKIVSEPQLIEKHWADKDNLYLAAYLRM